MFKLLGVLVLGYTVYAAICGEVHAKSGIRGRNVRREDSPRYFWACITIYAGLGVALILLF